MWDSGNSKKDQKQQKYGVRNCDIFTQSAPKRKIMRWLNDKIAKNETNYIGKIKKYLWNMHKQKYYCVN
jgi:hypothetical protein